MNKICRYCKKELPLEQFYCQLTNGKIYHRGECKSCFSLVWKIKYRTNPAFRNYHIRYRPKVISKKITEQPAIEQPITEQPKIQQPITEQPILNQPITEQPILNQPKIEQPILNQPITEQPILNQPITEQPILNQPITESIIQPVSSFQKHTYHQISECMIGNMAHCDALDHLPYSIIDLRRRLYWQFDRHMRASNFNTYWIIGFNEPIPYLCFDHNFLDNWHLLNITPVLFKNL